MMQIITSNQNLLLVNAAHSKLLKMAAINS